MQVGLAARLPFTERRLCAGRTWQFRRSRRKILGLFALVMLAGFTCWEVFGVVCLRRGAAIACSPRLQPGDSCRRDGLQARRGTLLVHPGPATNAYGDRVDNGR
jgi:hypothetical protein